MLIHCLLNMLVDQQDSQSQNTELNIVEVYNKQKDGHICASKSDIYLYFYTI